MRWILACGIGMGLVVLAGCKTAENTLAIMAMGNNAGGGPPRLIYKNKRRRHVSYRRGDLDAWAAKKVRRVE